MSHKTENSAGEQSHGHTNAEEKKELKGNYSINENWNETGTSETLIERMPINGTPFTAARTEKGCFGYMGRIRITEYMETMPEVEDKLQGFDWNTVLAVTTTVAELTAIETIERKLKERGTLGKPIEEVFGK